MNSTRWATASNMLMHRLSRPSEWNVLVGRSSRKRPPGLIPFRCRGSSSTAQKPNSTRSHLPVHTFLRLKATAKERSPWFHGRATSRDRWQMWQAAEVRVPCNFQLASCWSNHRRDAAQLFHRPSGRQRKLVQAARTRCPASQGCWHEPPGREISSTDGAVIHDAPPDPRDYISTQTR
jgi:hypothetical protein